MKGEGARCVTSTTSFFSKQKTDRKDWRIYKNTNNES